MKRDGTLSPARWGRWWRILAGSILLLGCGPVLDAGSTGDVRRLLERQRLPVAKLQCDVSLRERHVTCQWSADQAAVQQLLERLQLQPSSRESGLVSLVEDAGRRCGRSTLEARAISGRPPSLRLEAGMAFESLVVVPGDGETPHCLALVYSYG